MRFLKITGKLILGLLGLLILLYVVFYFIASGDYKVALTVEQDPSIPHVTLDNVTMHVETFGADSNEVVIIIHGGPGNDFKYLLDLKSLANEYFVVFYDQRGTGLSPRVPAEELTMDNLVQDLYDLSAYYGKGKPVHLIGHSWGGMLATAFVTKHPERVDKLVLAEPGPLTPEMASRYNAKMQLELSWELLVHLGKSYFKSLHVEEIDEQARGDFFFQTFAMDTTVDNHPLAAYFCNRDISQLNPDYWRYSATTSYQVMFKGMQDAENQMNIGSGSEVFTNKILLLAGECNQLTGPEFQKQQMTLFYDIEMVTITNAGHFMLSEQPEQSLGAIRKYFSE